MTRPIREAHALHTHFGALHVLKRVDPKYLPDIADGFILTVGLPPLVVIVLLYFGLPSAGFSPTPLGTTWRA